MPEGSGARRGRVIVAPRLHQRWTLATAGLDTTHGVSTRPVAPARGFYAHFRVNSQTRQMSKIPGCVDKNFVCASTFIAFIED